MLGSTRILNPLTGEQPTIQALCDAGIAPTVMTMNGPEVAEIPFLKGRDAIYEITLASGEKFAATGKHRILTPLGYRFVEDLQSGHQVFSYSLKDVFAFSENHRKSISEPGLLVHASDDRHWLQIPEDFLADYPSSLRSCDERLRPGLEIFQASSQLQGDAPKRTLHNGSGVDAPENRFQHNQTGKLSVPLSNEDFLCLGTHRRMVQTLHAPTETHVPDGALFRLHSQSLSKSSHLCASGEQDLSLPHNERFASFGELVQETCIVSIRCSGYHDFYDVTVPGSGHYFAEGAIHHNSSKTWLIAKFVICDYWADPYKTLWLCSSTDRRGAELRIWGKIKEFFNRAKARYPRLPGRVLETKGCITPDEISEDQETARLLTRGILFIPCKQGNTWLGLGPYAGIKPPENGRLGHAGDEVSLMHPSFLDAYANWYGKENFRGLLAGNPGDLEDPLCTAAEPEEGWENWQDTGKTQEWRSKFYKAWVSAFDGRDTPNNDFPYENGKARFHYLIGKKKMDAVRIQYGELDWHWWNQCVGKPQTSMQTRRVLTRQLCEQNKVFDDVIWRSEDEVTTVAGLDAAYGGLGGDRCVLMRAQFGKDVDGNDIFAPHPYVIVPVSAKNTDSPAEDQIVNFCKTYCALNKIPARNFFFDARGTLAIRLAQLWSDEVNVVDFGGKPTNRPVSNQEYVWEGDAQSKRLKLCSEHYFNFVSELWFSVYYCIVGKQMRRMQKDVASEGYKRTWKYRASLGGQKIQVEPKDEMKQRTNESPDLMDANVIALEGARRLGFELAGAKASTENDGEDDKWLEREVAKYRNFCQRTSLKYASS